MISTAGSGTLAMARKLRPDAISLDLGLDDINGFVLLDLLKHDPETRDIPIHVISGADEAASVTDLGAFGVTGKPADDKDLARVFKRMRDQVAGARKGAAPGRATTRRRRRASCPSWPAPRSSSSTTTSATSTR